MDPKEWINSDEARERIREFTYWAFSPSRNKEYCYGRATGYIIDHDKRLAILVSDFSNADLLNLKSGDVVHYKSIPGETKLRIDASATRRRNDFPMIPCPDDRMPDDLDRRI
jgi:hypothetical protein